MNNIVFKSWSWQFCSHVFDKKSSWVECKSAFLFPWLFGTWHQDIQTFDSPSWWTRPLQILDGQSSWWWFFWIAGDSKKWIFYSSKMQRGQFGRNERVDYQGLMNRPPPLERGSHSSFLFFRKKTRLELSLDVFQIFVCAFDIFEQFCLPRDSKEKSEVHFVFW